MDPIEDQSTDQASVIHGSRVGTPYKTGGYNTLHAAGALGRRQGVESLGIITSKICVMEGGPVHSGLPPLHDGTK